MTPEDRERLERDIRACCERADFGGAATTAIRGYGPELYGFLVGFHRAEQDAAEVFSLVMERLFRGIPRFDWGCSFRTWAYTIAHNASATYRADAQRRGRRHVPLGDAPEVSQIVEQVRSETASHLRTETKSRVAALRASLTVEEQTLLSLRIDRDLAWDDIVLILRGGDERPTDEVLRRESAKMRKRYQALKDKLRELARQEGLLGKNR